MECIVGESVEGVDGREDPAVEVRLVNEKVAVEGHEIGLELG